MIELFFSVVSVVVFFCFFVYSNCEDGTHQTSFQPAIQIHDFHVSTAYERSFGFLCASKELKRHRFFEADTHCKFKRLLKAGLQR